MLLLHTENLSQKWYGKINARLRGMGIDINWTDFVRNVNTQNSDLSL
jgi:hypothetical protein